MLGVAECARKRGHEVRVYCPPGRMQTKGIMGNYYIGSVAERRMSDFINRCVGNEGGLNLFGTSKLIRQVEGFHPDIIHLHNLHSNYINTGMLFRYIKKTNVRLIWTLHDCWPFTGHCVHFQVSNCEKWKTLCENCDCYRQYPESFFFDDSRRQYQKKKKLFSDLPDVTLITPSKWLADLTRESFLKDYPVRIINNGIDTEVFIHRESNIRKRYSLENKKIVLGVAFSWGYRKGLDVFVELSRRLEPEFKIFLVGIDEKIRKTLPTNITCIDRTADKRELSEIYSMADVFVNPTREETFGLVNIEALSCGTPVITFHTGGSPECLFDGGGAIVEKDDIDGLLDSVHKICGDSRPNPEQCRKWAEGFDYRLKYEEYVNEYENAGG